MSLLILFGLASLPSRAATWGREAGLDALMWKIRSDFPDVRRVATEELAELLRERAEPLPLLVDVRSAEEHAQSHLAGAVRLDPVDAQGELAPAAVAALPRDRPLVVYCAVGYRSAQAARALVAAGFADVRNLEGSIFLWANEGRPLVRDEGSREVPAPTVHPYSATSGLLLDPRYRGPLAAEPERPAVNP